MRHFFDKLFNNFDTISAIALLSICIFSLVKNYIFSVGASNLLTLANLLYFIIPVSISCLIFLYSKSKRIESIRDFEFNKLNLNIFFYSFFYISLSGCILILKMSLYYYNIMFTFLFIISALSLFYMIYSYNTSRNFYFILLNIIIFSILYRASLFMLYPTVFGGDVWYHLNIAEQICQSGTLKGLGTYSYSFYPLMNIFIALTKNILNISLSQAELYSITLANAISILFVGLMSLELFQNKKISLYAMFLLSILATHIYHSFSLVGISIGFIYVPLFILLIIKNIKLKTMSYTLLTYILIVAIILSHPNSSVISVVMVVILLISFFSFSKIYQIPIDKSIILIALIMIIEMASYWMYISHFLDYTGSVYNNFMFRTLGEKIQLTGGSIDPIDPIPLLIRNLIFGISMMFTIFGFLRVFRLANNRTIAFSIMTLSMLVIGIVTSIIGLTSVLPWRWLGFGEIFKTIIFAFGISEILNLNFKYRKITRKLLLLTLCIFIILKMGGYNESSNFFGQKIFSNNDSQNLYREGLSYPEFYTFNFLIKNYMRPTIYTDNCDYINRMYFNESLKEDFIQNMVENDYKIKGIFVYRDYLKSAPTLYKAPGLWNYQYCKIARDPISDLKDANYAAIIYDSKETKCYAINHPKAVSRL